MFEGLIDRFQLIRRKVLGYGRITRYELDAIFKDIRISLLEADVNYKVVKNFIENLRKKLEKIEFSKSLKPGDLVIKVVYEELVELLGAKPRHLEFKKPGPVIISLLGLQGVGKTTTAAKLAQRYKNRNPVLVPADAKRPAAVQQLMMLAKSVNIPVCPMIKNSVIETIKNCQRLIKEKGYGIVIIDTAGRLHIDDDLVQELIKIHQLIKPDYRLLVVDGMAGQDAVNQAIRFNEKIGLDGAVLTKMDGDTRGGAALSIVSVTKIPIYFIGTSERPDGLEEFYPDRAAQRIMGMGDVASLVEKVKTIEKEVDQERLRKKVLKGELNLEDFYDQLKAIKKLGPLSKLAAMIPGVKETDVDENEFKIIEAIINSMTPQERRHPEIINSSRKKRIARGSGTSLADVNRLLKQFFYARDLLKKAGRMKLPGGMPFKF